jgi:hypothetical protein
MDYQDPARSVPRVGQVSLLSAGVKPLILVLLAAGAVSAQVYPPVGYPGGGGYPVPRGVGLPIPGQSKTKFYKGGDEIKSPKFTPGDQLSIEGPVYGNGYMLAVNVYWEKAAGATADTAAKKDDSTNDAWKDAPKPVATGSLNPPAASAPSTPPPAKPDADDPGPPTLKRGGASDVNREHASDLPPIPPTGPVNPPAPPPGSVRTPATAGNDDDAPIIRNGDDLIRKASAAAMDFTEGLPNYICKENIGRYQSETHIPNWQAIDVVTTDVIYENHKESYKNLTINGKPSKKSMEESGGSWSTGEFGTVLVNLFSPGVAEFTYQKDSRSGGVASKVYTFNVTHANSGCRLDGPRGRANLLTGLSWIGLDRPTHVARAAHRTAGLRIPGGLPDRSRGDGHRL